MKTFGHVGDPQAKPSDALEKPAFDQLQVDYLKKTFLATPPPDPAASMDDAIRVISWAAADNGQREVINHIQSLVDARKAQQ